MNNAKGDWNEYSQLVDGQHTIEIQIIIFVLIFIQQA
jgi:hypothetical protein